jgi:hypothetical protein
MEVRQTQEMPEIDAVAELRRSTVDLRIWLVSPGIGNLNDASQSFKSHDCDEKASFW